jgi:hypothetical protein
MAGRGAPWKIMGFPKKMRMALRRASIRLPFPTLSGKPGAPRPARRAGQGVARGELATGRCTRATKSTMSQNKSRVEFGNTLSGKEIAGRFSSTLSG